MSKNANHSLINCYLIKEGIFAQADYSSNSITTRHSLKSDFHGQYLEWLLNRTRTQLDESHEPSIGIEFKTLGAALKQARVDANISLTHLAEKYGLNTSYLSRTENGKISDAFPGNYLLALYQEGVSLDRSLLNAFFPQGDSSASTNDQLNSLKVLIPLLNPEIIGTIHQMVSSMVRTQYMDDTLNKSLVTHMDVNGTGS